MRYPFFLFALVLGSTTLSQRLPLMPWPQEVKEGQGRFAIHAPMGLRASDPGNALNSERVMLAFDRLRKRLGDRTGSEFFAREHEEGFLISLSVERVGKLAVGEDESYRLNIDSTGVIISATTDIGAVRAFSTLYQLLKEDVQGWYFPAVTITDAPRFPWRGLLMDVCRHWMPRDVILRELDGMELVKMNVLHLHLSEDQGFRIESKLFPELAEKGSEGNYFTQEDIRFIIREADLRGIRVIPEFDLPGHSTSWFVSHPELASAPGPYEVATTYGVLLPTFDPTNEATYTFLDAFLGEMAALFPDPYLHIGGDENNGKQWDANANIQAYMKAHGMKDNAALQAYFNTRLLAILVKHGKRMVGWDEIMEGELPSDITIQSWRGKEGLIAAAKSGRDVILSNGYYIDLCQPAGFHYANDPLPADIALSPEQQKHVLGGEATMWSEIVDARNVDTRIWPRTAVIAERLWSARDVKDVNAMYDRLDIVSLQLDAIGLRHMCAREQLVRIAGPQRSMNWSLLDKISPVPGYKRHSLHAGGYTTRTPLTSLADIAVPDASAGRWIGTLVDSFLVRPTRPMFQADLSNGLASLEQTAYWIDQLPEDGPIHEEMKPFGEQIKALCGAARSTMTQLQEGRKPTKEDILFRKTLIEKARVPIAECQLSIVDALEKLFKAAAER